VRKKQFLVFFFSIILVFSVIPQGVLAGNLVSAPHIKQLPELARGCEVTSLAMMLQHAGVKVDKMQLAKEVVKVPFKQNGLYGNPYQGFVGNIYTFTQPGLGVYHGPIEALAKKYLADRVINLTGSNIAYVYKMIDKGIPVWVITNSKFRKLASTEFRIWNTKQGKISITYREHSVLITGYDSKNVYINDPLYSSKNRAVNRANFEASWIQMGKQAISYFPENVKFFLDTEGHWAEKEIAYLSNLGYIKGRTNAFFKPNDAITRNEAAILIARIHNSALDNPPKPSFKDIDPTHTAYKSVAALVSEGIFEDGEYFRGNQTLTRGEMSKILVKTFDLPIQGQQSFTDIPAGHWSLPYVQTLFSYKITTGYADGSFKPAEPVTRAQFSVFLTRALTEVSE
jgi:uncharacterized protein YvpB